VRLAPGRTAVVSLILCLAALGPARAGAWGQRGHEIAATIAEARVGPAAREMLRELVGATPLADLAMWADYQRDRETRPWHYVNIAGPGGYDARRDCPDGSCVVARIEWAAAELTSAREPVARLRALRWLVHLVADVHQPLHASPFRDRGGNDLPVRIGKRRQPTDLHRVWDGDVVDAIAPRRSPADAARTISLGISPSDAAAWAAQLAPSSWADESAATVRTLYAELEHALEPRRIGALPRGYPAAQRAIAGRRLAQAGVRLAALLDRAAAERARSARGR
jgi:hypothetical protein